MGRFFSDSGGDGRSLRLARALARLDRLVDWERRDRSAGSGRSMRVDLAPIAALCAALDGPQHAFETVHVAGSKGKGSTAALVALGLARVGARVGLYTSPHVERLQERVVVDGASLADDALAAALERALAAREDGGAEAARATWFDVLTAAALDAFRAATVDVAVVECGLGGRLDSTNVVAPRLVVLTRIDREHVAVLGPTLARIAAEKAGVLAAGVPAVAADARVGVGAESDDDASGAVARVLRAQAAGLGASLCDVPGARRGPLRARNLALARAALERLGAGGFTGPDGRRPGPWCLADDDLPGLPGRLERRARGSVPVVLDGAHVAASLVAVLQDLAGDPALRGAPVCVFGCGRDKDAAGLLKALVGRVDRTLCTSAGDGPYAAPEALAETARGLGLRSKAVAPAIRAFDEALRAAEAAGGWVLVTGSLHLVGALRSATRATPC